ncbi:hypothetical protein GCM10023189_54750 [Nibrella saemangeumensis]|uniref:Uncharacterized protein n=1 Tax=Nibrella saemangeumensis TaxID=1084526 RepID=A0ABP8NPD8_9BACT
MIPKIPLIQKGPVNQHLVKPTGWILIGAGLFLMVFMGGLLAFCLGMFPLSAIFPGTYRDPNAPAVSLGLGAALFIGFIFCFGVVSFTEGFWRLRYGKSNPRLMLAILVLGQLFITGGLLARAFR